MKLTGFVYNVMSHEKSKVDDNGLMKRMVLQNK